MAELLTCHGCVSRRAFHTDGDGVAFSRLWNVNPNNPTDEVLLSHQWVTGSGHSTPALPMMLAPLKQMKIYKDGSPRAMFWSGNEKLKGDAITLPPVPPIKPPAKLASSKPAA